ncbi:Choline transporter-like protein 5-A [Echinococcus granulosus]|uniref:Choline transporter-like protein 5-A n=1 Tax=Echinococcus granulosus TaxID=6210 RepID=W6UI27_ECHGR|nr:Choline transporter-like protein 5-A [Echinococcus granulosus]EUB61135.1 Choline transporter-like protein 5-A [Echinococcus granulosus]
MGQKHSSQGNRATQSSVEDVSSARGDRKSHQEITLPVKNREQKYLFFFDMFSCLYLPEVVIQYGCPTKQVCVSSCPNYTWKASEGDSFESRSKMICEGGVSGNFEAYKLKSVSDLIQSGICAPEVLPTEAMFRRCVQLDIVPAIDQLNRRTLANPEAERPLLSCCDLPCMCGRSDPVELSTRIAINMDFGAEPWLVNKSKCILLAAIASFLWIFFMRMCTCAMVVFTLVAFVSIFGLGVTMSSLLRAPECRSLSCSKLLSSDAPIEDVNTLPGMIIDIRIVAIHATQNLVRQNLVDIPTIKTYAEDKIVLLPTGAEGPDILAATTGHRLDNHYYIGRNVASVWQLTDPAVQINAMMRSLHGKSLTGTCRITKDSLNLPGLDWFDKLGIDQVLIKPTCNQTRSSGTLLDPSQKSLMVVTTPIQSMTSHTTFCVTKTLQVLRHICGCRYGVVETLAMDNETRFMSQEFVTFAASMPCFLLMGKRSATGFCFWRYVETKKVNANSPPLFLTLDITVYFCYSTTWLILGIISGLILFLVLLIIIFIREKIVLAYRVIGEASKAIGYLPMTLFWPIIPFILIFGTIALWIFVDLNLRSIAVSEGVNYANSTVGLRYKSPEEWTAWALNASMKCDPTANNTEGQICLFVKHITTAYTPWLQVYNFFMCVWLINFFIAMDQITLAGAFATFYFNSQSQRRRHTIVGCCGLWLLFGTCVSALVYNTGSLALGSILITIFWFLRACLLRLERRLKTANNELAQFFLRCFCCCLWCLEKFLRFLNKNAYIMIAIYGHGFCRSARDAFQLIVRNVVRVFLVEKITDYILVVGKLAVSAAASCLAYFYLGGVIPDKLNLVPEQNLQLNYIFVPILVIAIASYLVAKAFFSVYEMGVDTIFICVCEDLERNDGTAEKPYFMNKSTMKMLKKPDAETSLS